MRAHPISARVLVLNDPAARDLREADAASDAAALHAWRLQCPQVRALWYESGSVTEWEGVTFRKAGDADAGRVMHIQLVQKGLTGELPAALNSPRWRGWSSAATG